MNCIFSIKKLLFVVIDTRTAMHNNASFEFALRSYLSSKIPIKKIKIKLIKSEISLKGKNVTFIKYDIEGYELKALRGSEQTIKKYSPVVVIEQNRGNSFPQELLESWGYVCKGVDKVFNQDYIMVKE